MAGKSVPHRKGNAVVTFDFAIPQSYELIWAQRVFAASTPRAIPN